MKLKAQLSPEGVMLLEKRFMPAMEKISGKAMNVSVNVSTDQDILMSIDGEKPRKGARSRSSGAVVNWTVLIHKDRVLFELRDAASAAIVADGSLVDDGDNDDDNNSSEQRRHASRNDFRCGDGVIAGGCNRQCDVLLSIPSRYIFERATIEGVGADKGSIALSLNIALLLRAFKTLNAQAAEEIVLRLGIKPLIMLTEGGAAGRSDGGQQHQQQQQQYDPQAERSVNQAFLSFQSKGINDMLVVQNVPVVRVDSEVRQQIQTDSILFLC